MKVTKSIIAVLLCLSAGSAYADCEYYLTGNKETLNMGLTLSGTKTHCKQRFLPLTPLLMVSDVLWSPVLPA